MENVLAEAKRLGRNDAHAKLAEPRSHRSILTRVAKVALGRTMRQAAFDAAETFAITQAYLNSFVAWEV